MVKSVKSFLMVVILAVLAVWAGSWLSNRLGEAHKQPVHLATGAMLPTPMAVKAFHLMSGHDAIDAAKLKGHWHVMFFGFTHCPDLCPTTLSMLNRVVARFEGHATAPQVWFVSIDPKHDTPVSADHYAKSFNQAFTGLSGSSADVAALAKQMNVAYGPVMTMQGGKSSQSMNHSGHLVVINPQGDVVALLTHPSHEDDVYSDLKAVMHQG